MIAFKAPKAPKPAPRIDGLSWFVLGWTCGWVAMWLLERYGR